MSIFLSKYNLKNLKSINNAQKLYLIGFFLISTIFIWFFLIYSTINKELEYNACLLQKAKEKKALIKISEDTCLKIENKIKNLKSDINDSSNKDPKKEILRFAKDSGISLKSYILLNKNIKTQYNLAQDTTSYEFTGTIDQIVLFLNKLNLYKNSLKCEEISITKRSESEFNIKCMLILLNKH